MELAAHTIDYLKGKQLKEFAVLHCVSSYPAPLNELNLRSIDLMAKEFDLTVGYSDHTIGTDAAAIAVAAGARIIEKHFTLDKNYSEFRDHKISADPSDLKNLVSKIRLAEQMMGSRVKIIMECEKATVKLIRRSIVAGCDLSKGAKLQFKDLTWIRPSGGLSPGMEDIIIGKVLKRPVKFGEQILESDVE